MAVFIGLAYTPLNSNPWFATTLVTLLPSLPRRLKTHLAFSVFLILGTNLWQHHNSAVQGAYWALMQCSIVILRWSSPLCGCPKLDVWFSLCWSYFFYCGKSWNGKKNLFANVKKFQFDQENILPFELPLAMRKY